MVGAAGPKAPKTSPTTTRAAERGLTTRCSGLATLAAELDIVRRVMTRSELLAALDNVLNNIVFGLLLTRIVKPEQWTAIDQPTATFQGSTGDLLRLSIAPMRDRMADPAYRKLVNEEFENCLKRATVSEGHELLLLYCENTGQYAAYKAQPWYQFARIIRNVVSHKDGGALRRWPDDLTKQGIREVSWRHHVLRASDIGAAVSFTLHDALQLLKDQIDFVQAGLA
jgi:hypothetical protein